MSSVPMSSVISRGGPIELPRLLEVKGVFPRAGAPRLAALALLACGLLCVCTSRDARAEARFGDSAWVAPVWPIDGDGSKDGPRVAAPDHERRWETALR